MPEFPVRIGPVSRMIAPIIRREPSGMPAMIVAQPSAVRPSPFRVVGVHPIGMVPMPPPIVVIGAFVRSAPTPKRVRFPERRPEPVRMGLVVVLPPIPPFHHPFRMIRIHPLGIIGMPPSRVAPNVAVVVGAEARLCHRRSGHQRANYGTQQQPTHNSRFHVPLSSLLSFLMRPLFQLKPDRASAHRGKPTLNRLSIAKARPPLLFVSS